MARTLWNKNRSFDEIVTETFSDAYGEDGKLVAEHFQEMSRLWHPLFEPIFSPKPDDERILEGKENLIRAKEAVSRFKPPVAKNLENSQGAILWSWRYLERYLELMDLLLPAFESYVNCSPDCEDKFGKVFDFLWRNEEELHPALDVFAYINVLRQRPNEVEAVLEKSNVSPE